MFIDAGYLARAPKIQGPLPEPKDNETHLAYNRNLAAYGDYDQYLTNLKRLYDGLKESDIRTAFVVAEERLNGKYTPHDPHFIPFSQSRILHMVFGRGCYFSRAPNMLYELKLEGDRSTIRTERYIPIKDFVKEAGELLLLAGELATCKHSDTGCVGGILEEVDGRIEMLGVRGCIFPLKPYRDGLKGVWETPWGKRISEMHDRLYYNAMNPDDIIASRNNP